MQRVPLNHRRLSDLIYAALRERLPWLVAEWNGIEWESERTIVRRRLSAMEAHLRDMEGRYAELENRLLHHSQARTHKPARDVLPAPDSDWVFPPYSEPPNHVDEATGIGE